MASKSRFPVFEDFGEEAPSSDPSFALNEAISITGTSNGGDTIVTPFRTMVVGDVAFP